MWYTVIPVRILRNCQKVFSSLPYTFSLATTIFYYLEDEFDRKWEEKEKEGVLFTLKWIFKHFIDSYEI